MNYIDLNKIGSFFYKENISNIDKRKLPFSKIEQLSDELIEKIFYSIESIKKRKTKNDSSYINCLKCLLVLCYINNININRYISLKVNDDEENK